VRWFRFGVFVFDSRKLLLSLFRELYRTESVQEFSGAGVTADKVSLRHLFPPLLQVMVTVGLGLEVLPIPDSWGPQKACRWHSRQHKSPLSRCSVNRRSKCRKVFLWIMIIKVTRRLNRTITRL